MLSTESVKAPEGGTREILSGLTPLPPQVGAHQKEVPTHHGAVVVPTMFGGRRWVEYYVSQGGGGGAGMDPKGQP